MSLLARNSFLVGWGLALAVGLHAQELQILAPDGSPVAGASVELRGKPPGEDLLSQLLPPLVSGETDEAGRLPGSFPRLEDLQLLVDHPDFLPVAIRLADSTLPPQLSLQPGKAWAGRIGFPGRKLKEGRVCVFWQEPQVLWGLRKKWRRCSDLSAAGRFQLRGLPDGELSLVATASGLLPIQVTTRPGTDDLRFKAGIVLRGKVEDATGEPVAGAEIFGKPPRHSTADPNGRFLLAVEQMPATLDFRAPGFRSQKIRVRSPGEDLLVRLLPGEQVQGWVFTADGEALPEALALVQELKKGGTRTSQTRVKLEENSFRLDLPSEGVFAVSLRAPGYRAWTSKPFSVGLRETHLLAPIVLTRDSSIEGRVIEESSGGSLEGVVVTLLPRGLPLTQSLQDGELESRITDSAGRFRWTGLRPGGYELRLRRGVSDVKRLSLELSDEERLDLGPIPLGAGRPLIGQLANREGEGVQECCYRVEVFDPAAQVLIPTAVAAVEVGGRFEVPALFPALYRARVIHARGQPVLEQEFQVEEGSGAAELKLKLTRVRLRGEVLRPEGPVAGGTLSLEAALDPGHFRGKFSLSHSEVPGLISQVGMPGPSIKTPVQEDGSFTLAEVPTGLLWATFVAPDSKIFYRLITIPDEAEPSVRIDLDGFNLAGRAIAAEVGSGVVAQIRVLEASGRVVASVQSDKSGDFRCTGLEEGSYSVESRAEGYISKRVPVVAVGPGSEPITLEMARGQGGSLNVTLLRPDGSPVAWSMATLLSASGTMIAAGPTNRWGGRTFENLAPGTYFVVWDDSVTGVGISPAQTVEPNLPLDLTFRPGPGNGLIVHCPAPDCQGRAVGSLRVLAATGIDLTPYLPGAAADLRFSEEGSLTLGRLSGGPYLLQVEVGDLRWQRWVDETPAAATARRLP